LKKLEIKKGDKIEVSKGKKTTALKPEKTDRIEQDEIGLNESNMKTIKAKTGEQVRVKRAD
jgi:ribosomal protein L24